MILWPFPFLPTFCSASMPYIPESWKPFPTIRTTHKNKRRLFVRLFLSSNARSFFQIYKIVEGPQFVVGFHNVNKHPHGCFSMEREKEEMAGCFLGFPYFPYWKTTQFQHLILKMHLMTMFLGHFCPLKRLGYNPVHQKMFSLVPERPSLDWIVDEHIENPQAFTRIYK